MAFFDNTRTPANAGSAGGIGNVFLSAFGSLAAWNDTRVTRKSLSSLSDRELDDIGHNRGDIDKVARR